MKDLQCVWRMAALCSALPDPDQDFGPWLQFIVCAPARWSQAYNCIHFVESACDLGAGAVPSRDAPITAHRCPQCPSSFASARALKSHMRTKHGAKAPQRIFCLPDGVCQVCKTQFRSRLRLLAHLCDSRRTKCWDTICSSPSSYNRLSSAQCTELDSLDNVQRRDARRAGHSHALAVGQAYTASGRAIGCAKR